MKLKTECCEKFKSKAKACKGCPVLGLLSKKKRKLRLKKIKKRLRKAAA